MPVETEEDRRSILATTSYLQGSLGLSARDRDAGQVVSAGPRDTKAVNRHRAY